LILRIVDKLIFGAALLLALQIPLLADHYQQYLSGMYQATKLQVDGYEATAKANQFADVQSMIDNHLQNSEPSVRDDARQKLATMDVLADLTQGMAVFKQGYLVEKLLFMLHPSRYGNLKAVISQFTPGIPLTLSGLAFAVVVALLLNLLLMLPFQWGRTGKRPVGNERKAHS
jgi:hypothetical protein